MRHKRRGWTGLNDRPCERMLAIRARRVDLGVKQEALVYDAGCCRQHLAECECGSKRPSPELMDRCERVLGLVGHKEG